jgi:ribosomal protein L17
MYINKVEDLIDKVIDDFFAKSVSGNKLIKSILSETNFVKFQKDINQLLESYIKTVPIKTVNEIVKKGDSVNSIYNTLKKYCAIYLLLFIGFFYTGKHDTYINNIIEFTKNQASFPFKVENFFNAESNAKIIDYYHMIKNLITLFDQERPRLSSIEREQQGKETIEFITQFDDEFIKDNFMISNKQDQAHNMIKTLIVLLIYRVYEKKDFFKMLELTESGDGEYMFIDIVVPTKQYMDFNSIESLLSQEDIINGLAYDLWDYLGELESSGKELGKTIDDKILDLVNSGILVPIVDDFLLYHKDTEKYDRNMDVNSIKKKEDTKVRYIINKIDSVSELYTDAVKKNPKLLSSIKKNFYVPLNDRKAILKNDFEEIKIINKFLNQGKRNTENNEYFNDLVNYRDYPYINFKEFKKHGFSMVCNETIRAVRAVSFDTDGDFKQNSKNKLQFRVGGKDMIVNVVGFMIPATNKHMKCIRIRDMKDVRSISKKSDNGIDLVSGILNNTSVAGKQNKSPYFWLFDLKTDNIKAKTYEHNAKNSQSDRIKQVVGELYDRVVDSMHWEIVKQIEDMESVTLQQAQTIINNVQRRLLKFPKKYDMIPDLEKFIYTKKLRVDASTYDKSDDTLFGLTGEVFKLTDNPLVEEEGRHKFVIDFTELDESGQQEQNDVVVGICQHNITWDDIAKKKRADPKTYMEDIYEFIKQYVTENSSGDYICKSCGFQLNISKYARDGSFDDDTQKFITYSMPMEIPLEDIPEYEKFKPSIKIIDKLVEKIASINNITYLVGSNTTTKWKRKAVVKNVIDIVISNNNFLKHKFKERNERVAKAYGINRNHSHLFVFDLDNSIFQFSSQDKDQYKPIKMNNIVAYIILLLIIDMNEQQLTFLPADKKFFCDFDFFDKYHQTLLHGTKILKNNKNDTLNITDYKLFCYALYMTSCKMAKHRLWHHESNKTKTVSVKMIPIIQKSIMHTVIDLANSVLENSFKKNAGYEMEMFRTKLYDKISTVFSNNDAYLSIKNRGKSSTAGEKKSHILLKSTAIESKWDGFKREYDEPRKWNCCRQVRYYMPGKAKLFVEFSELSSITSCENGEFHKWKPNGGTFECKLCKNKLSSLMISNKKSNVDSKFRLKNLTDLSKIYCNSGSIHQFIDADNGKRKCIKCNQYEDKSYTDNELLTLQKNMQNKKSQHIAKAKDIINNILNKEKDERSYIMKVKDSIVKDMNNASNKNEPFKYIDNLIKNMEVTIGNDKNILKKAKLKENIYIVDHDHMGHSLDSPIIITDSDNKIHFKNDHSYYKTDVLYYTNYKGTKVDVFYDAITKILLGYKEESKNYMDYKKGDRKLSVEYSIYNKLMLLGYRSQYVDIMDEYEHIIKKFNKFDRSDENKQKMYKQIVHDIIKNRHQNIKKAIYDFQRIFNKIINNYKPPKNMKDENIDDDTYFADKMESIVTKYRKKLSNMFISEKGGKGRIMKHWKGAVRDNALDDLNDIYFNFSDKLIDVNIINTYDNAGNMMLFFLIRELNKLIEYNTNKFTKISVVTFLIDYINTVFEFFNIESLMDNKDIKRFTFVLKSEAYLRNLAEKDDVESNKKGIYEEYTDPEEDISEEQVEDIQDAIEEQDALDMDTEIDYEGDFDASYDWEPMV